MKKFADKSPEQLVQQLETISTQYDLTNDRSIIPPRFNSASVVAEYRDSAEARAQWNYRFDLFRDLIRESRDGHVGSEQKTLIKLEILNRIQAALGEHSTFLDKLFPHQRNVFSDLADFLEQGDSSGWIKMPTGSGKTAIFCSLAKIAGVKTLILVPKLNLIDQTIRSLERFGDLNMSVSTVSGSSSDTSGDVVICTYQSIGKILRSSESFPLVIGDEAHRMLTSTRLEAIQKINGKQFLIGLSATPKFSEEKSLALIGNCIHELPITKAIRANIISGIRVIVATTTIDLSLVPRNSSNGEYQVPELAAAINTPPRNRAVIELLKQDLFSEKTTAISCVNIDHANSLHQLAVQAGLKAGVVHSRMDKDTKESTLTSLDNGDIQFLFFVDQLTEGWDCPRAEILVNARPTQSIVVAEQRGGRVLRNHTFADGRVKTHGLVIEILDRGTRPILMSDIVGGTFVLPESLSYEESVKSENTKLRNTSLPEGVQLVWELEEVAQTVRGLDPEEARGHRPNEMTPELVRDIVLNSGITKHSLLSSTEFFSKWFEHERFSGSGRKLVRLYFQDSKNLELKQIDKEHYTTMCSECDIGRGPKMNRELVREIILNTAIPAGALNDASLFFDITFDHEKFTGNGRKLVRDYFRDSKNLEFKIASIRHSLYDRMCNECDISRNIEPSVEPQMVKMDRELVKEIILNSRISAEALYYPTRFYTTTFNHEKFTGNGRELIRDYFRDVKKQDLQLRYITQKEYGTMCDECDIARNLEPRVQPQMPKMDRERVRKILLGEHLEGVLPTHFFKRNFNREGFQGTGKALVRDYFRDSKGQEHQWVNTQEYNTMCYECDLLVPAKPVSESDWYKAVGLVPAESASESDWYKVVGPADSHSSVYSFLKSPKEFSEEELSEIIVDVGVNFRFDRKSLFENLLQGNHSLSFGDLAEKVSPHFAETFQQALISSYLRELADPQKVEVIKALVLHYFPDSAPSWERFSAVGEYQIVDLIPQEIPCLVDATFKIDRSRPMSHQYLLGALGLDLNMYFYTGDLYSSSRKTWNDVIKDSYQHLDPLTELEDYKFGLKSFALEKTAQIRIDPRDNFQDISWADYHVSGARSESAADASYDAFMKALFSTNGSDVVGFNDVVLRVGETNKHDLITFYRDLGLHALSARSSDMEAIIKPLLLKAFVGLPSLSELQHIGVDIAARLPDKYEIADGAFITWDAGCGVNGVQLKNALKLSDSDYESLWLRFYEEERSHFQDLLKSLHESERAATTNQLHLESGLPDGTKLYIQERGGEENVVRMYQLTERYEGRSRAIKVTEFKNEDQLVHSQIVLSRDFFDSYTGFVEMPTTTLDSAPILLSLEKLGEHIFSADAAGSNEPEGLKFLETTGGRVPDDAIITITDDSGQKIEYALCRSDSRSSATMEVRQKNRPGFQQLRKSTLANSDGDLIFDDPKLVKKYRIPLKKAFERWG